MQSLADKKAELIARLAKADAASFVAEFDCELDPSETDWDAVAWGLCDLGEFEADRDDLWTLYSAQLVSYTESMIAAQNVVDQRGTEEVN